VRVANITEPFGCDLYGPLGRLLHSDVAPIPVSQKCHVSCYQLQSDCTTHSQKAAPVFESLSLATDLSRCLIRILDYCRGDLALYLAKLLAL